MKTHQLICAQCGDNFESSRSDTKYCTNSCKTRASQLRKNKNTSVNIQYDQDEYLGLIETADLFSLSVEDLIKHRSLITKSDIFQKKKAYEELELENKALKAELSIYNETESDGIFLDVSFSEKQLMLESIKNCSFIKKQKSNHSKAIFAAVILIPNLEKIIYDCLKALKENRIEHEITID